MSREARRSRSESKPSQHLLFATGAWTATARRGLGVVLSDGALKRPHNVGCGHSSVFGGPRF